MLSRARTHEDSLDMDATILNSLYNAAKAINNTTERNELQTILFSSIDDGRGVAKAALHIAYQMTCLKQKVLLINMDALSEGYFRNPLKVEGERRLLWTLQQSKYLSEAIESTQYEELDYIGMEDVEEREVVKLLSHYNLKEKLTPLKNYYDRIIVVGPEYNNFSKYSAILELTDSSVTISKNRTSDYRKLQKYLSELELFNVYSLGIIRHQ